MHCEELRKKYSVEMEDDLDINVANVLQKQLSAPGIKHKWLHRLVQERIYLFKLQKEQEEIINSLVNDTRVTLSKPAIEAKAKINPRYKELSEEIVHQTELIEYIESYVNKILYQLTYDIKNIVDLIKLEQL